MSPMAPMAKLCTGGETRDREVENDPSETWGRPAHLSACIIVVLSTVSFKTKSAERVQYSPSLTQAVCRSRRDPKKFWCRVKCQGARFSCRVLQVKVFVGASSWPWISKTIFAGRDIFCRLSGVFLQKIAAEGLWTPTK